MKRTLRVTLFSGLAALLLGLGAAVPASAATTPATPSTSSASTTFTASTQPMSLTTVPGITFASTLVPDTATNGSYNAASVTNPLTVTNPGYATGYTVDVQNTPFNNSDATATAGDGKVLSGAVLNLPAPVAAAANEGNPSTGPVTSAVTLSGDNTNQVVETASANGGLGVWNSPYTASGINLTVPAGQEPGSYTSTLTWTLGNTVA